MTKKNDISKFLYTMKVTMDATTANLDTVNKAIAVLAKDDQDKNAAVTDLFSELSETLKILRTAHEKTIARLGTSNGDSPDISDIGFYL